MAIWLTLLIATSTFVVIATIYFRRMHRLAASLPHAFRCKVVLVAPDADAKRIRWPRRPSLAVWVHDVLVVFSGFGSAHVHAHAVHFAEGLFSLPRPDAVGLGGKPVVLALELDDGGTALLATHRESRTLVAGPFLAALISSDAATNSDR